jgi:serine-type D-Ala-D-Ala carboxypeptidase/endopeptidase
VLTVTAKDEHLMVQATGQDEYEVFPESDTRFFYRVVDPQVTFELDGTASALALHQNGRDRRGVRSP